MLLTKSNNMVACLLYKKNILPLCKKTAFSFSTRKVLFLCTRNKTNLVGQEHIFLCKKKTFFLCEREVFFRARRILLYGKKSFCAGRQT